MQVIIAICTVDHFEWNWRKLPGSHFPQKLVAGLNRDAETLNKLWEAQDTNEKVGLVAGLGVVDVVHQQVRVGRVAAQRRVVASVQTRVTDAHTGPVLSGTRIDDLRRGPWQRAALPLALHHLVLLPHARPSCPPSLLPCLIHPYHLRRATICIIAYTSYLRRCPSPTMGISTLSLLARYQDSRDGNSQKVSNSMVSCNTPHRYLSATAIRARHIVPIRQRSQSVGSEVDADTWISQWTLWLKKSVPERRPHGVVSHQSFINVVYRSPALLCRCPWCRVAQHPRRCISVSPACRGAVWPVQKVPTIVVPNNSRF